MKRAAVAMLGLYAGYYEFRYDLLWILTIGECGQVQGQVAILGVLALLVFGTFIWMGYRALGYLLD